MTQKGMCDKNTNTKNMEQSKQAKHCFNLPNNV